MTEKETTGRVAVVTGGSRGIGRAVALSLADAGFDVVVNYARSAGAADDVVRHIKSVGKRAMAVRADVSCAEDRRRLVEAVKEGMGRIDLLVNNAGVAPKVRADLLEASEESFDYVLDVNLKGPYFLTQAVAREMIGLVERDQSARPKIITIGSISADTVSTNRGEYCISKAGLTMMTKLFADRLAEYGILVYEVRPGIIETDMTAAVKEKYDRLFAEGITPIRRWGQPEDVGRAVAAIAQDLFPYSTGEVIHVDGGFHIKRL